MDQNQETEGLIMEFPIENMPIEFAPCGTSPMEIEPNLNYEKLHKLLDTEESEGEEEDLDEEGSDLDFPTSSQQVKKESKVRSVSKLPPHFKGLMGEANIRFVRGDIETAQQMCFEVIRQIPNAHEPYLTLAQIYENVDRKKYKGYLTVAGYLNPTNIATWARLAELSLEEGNVKEAITFYTRAINAEPRNVEMHEKRFELGVKEFGPTSTKIYMYKKTMVRHYPVEKYDTIIKLAKEMAEIYHKDQKYQDALSILEVPFLRVPKFITPDLINMILELYLILGKYSQCLDFLVEFCNFKFEIDIDDEGKLEILSYEIPANVPIDIKTKFILCMIKIANFQVAIPLVDNMLMSDDVETIGDLYLDIAEAFVAVKKPEMALKLLIPLVKSKNFSLAAVWLKYAESLAACNLNEQAVEAYFTVMALAPQHLEVLYPLAMLLLKLDKKQEALSVMSQDLSSNKIDVGVLLEQMRLLKQIGDLGEYWKCVELLLSRHCIVIKNAVEMKTLVSLVHQADMHVRIAKTRQFVGDTTPTLIKDLVSLREPSVEEEYQLFKSILQFAKDTKAYTMFKKFAIMGLSSKKFANHLTEIKLFAQIACLLSHDYLHGHLLAREFILRSPTNNLVWNLFNLNQQMQKQAGRHIKFLQRFRSKYTLKNDLEIIEMNNDITIGNYGTCLNFFMREFKKHKSPYLAFILGMIMLQMLCQRTFNADKKQLSETVTHLFMYYAKHRSSDANQEIYFNLGRMYQQLGIMYLAEHYYRKVLKVDNDLLDLNPDILGLKEEAAFNLHLLYLNSNNKIAARQVLMEHIVI